MPIKIEPCKKSVCMCMCTSMQTLYICTYVYPSSSMHELCVQVGFTHKPENICIRTYCIAEIFLQKNISRYKFHNLCVDSSHLCFDIDDFMNWIKLRTIQNFNPTKISRYMVRM